MTDKSVAKKKKVSVNHEWGTLKDVIIGCQPIDNKMTFPKMKSGKKPLYMTKRTLELSERFPGESYYKIRPTSVRNFRNQADEFALLAQQHGASIHRNDPLPVSKSTGENYFGLQLYTRDPILVIGNKIIITNLKSPARRMEQRALESIISDIHKNYKAELIYMPKNKEGFATDNIYLEGGDVLLNGYNIYVGNSGNATNVLGIEWLRNTLGSAYKVHEIKLKNNVLHLDCAMMLLNKNLGVLCEDDLVGVSSEKDIKGVLPSTLEEYKWISATPEEAKTMGTNGCILNSNTVIMDAHHPDIAEEIRKKKHTVIEIPYISGMSLGGGLRCSHHPLIRESELP
ncbi:MAG: hypothetical protein JKY02_07795 [Flavobacteriaceae bacterium]|nr:hypothetical protein [Flavobacteriaceae bacterium]